VQIIAVVLKGKGSLINLLQGDGMRIRTCWMYVRILCMKGWMVLSLPKTSSWAIHILAQGLLAWKDLIVKSYPNTTKGMKKLERVKNGSGHAVLSSGFLWLLSRQYKRSSSDFGIKSCLGDSPIKGVCSSVDSWPWWPLWPHWIKWKVEVKIKWSKVKVSKIPLKGRCWL